MQAAQVTGEIDLEVDPEGTVPDPARGGRQLSEAVLAGEVQA